MPGALNRRARRIPIAKGVAMADQQKVMNRWLVVVGGILIQLCLGAIYAWGVFTPSLADAGWTKAQTQFVFSAGLVSFAGGKVIAGYYSQLTFFAFIFLFLLLNSDSFNLLL